DLSCPEHSTGSCEEAPGTAGGLLACVSTTRKLRVEGIRTFRIAGDHPGCPSPAMQVGSGRLHHPPASQPAATAFGSLGRPSTRSPTMLRWISAVPPRMVSDREKKNEAYRSDRTGEKASPR